MSNEERESFPKKESLGEGSNSGNDGEGVKQTGEDGYGDGRTETGTAGQGTGQISSNKEVGQE